MATFLAIRSANRSARVAEQALLAAMRPLLVQSLSADPTHKALWGDRHTARIAGGRAIAEIEGDVIYLAIGLRNVGSGIAMLHGWWPSDQPFGNSSHAAPDDFRKLTIAIDLLYGDQDGGQRTISRFVVLPAGDDGWYTQVGRHWNLDRPDRSR